MYLDRKYRSIKKGNILVNIMFIMMIISLLSVCTYSIIHNNLIRTSIKYTYVDLYNQQYIEDSISKINFYLKDKNVDLDLVKENKETLNIDSNLFLKYDYHKSRFIMIDVSNGRVEMALREKKLGDNWCVVPKQQKYKL